MSKANYILLICSTWCVSIINAGGVTREHQQPQRWQTSYNASRGSPVVNGFKLMFVAQRLTHWILWKCIFQNHFTNWYLEHFLWNWSYMNPTEPLWWRVNIMMTSSNGNIFRVTGHFCREFTGDWWIPRTKASDAELWCFSLIVAWTNG